MKMDRAESTRTQSPMQHGYRELLSPHMVRVTLATSAAFVFVLALVGPAGTFYSRTLLERMGFSLLYAGAGWPLCYAQKVIVHYLFRFRKPVEIWIAVVVATMYTAWPISAMVFAVESLAYTDAAEIGLLHIYVLVAVSAAAWSTLSCYLVWQRVRHVAPVVEPVETRRDLPEFGRDTNGATRTPNGEVTTGLHPSDSNDASPAVAAQDESADGAGEESAAGHDESADSRPHPSGGTPASEQAPRGALQLVPERPARKQSALLKLLPERLGTDLVYIKSEDHYLEVHTTVGSSLVKMRFSDAVDELGDRGMQVHRSYWVATSHVTRSARSGKRTVLRLTGDHKVPVSVTHLPAVRAALGR